MQEITTYPGTQLTLSYSFTDPSRPGLTIAPTNVRFRIFGPGGQLVLDTATLAAPIEDVVPGQLLQDSPSRFTLLWSIDPTINRGRYSVEALGTIGSDSIDDTVGTIWIGEPLSVSLSAMVQDPAPPVEAYRCFFYVNDATQLRLLRELVTMAKSDKLRRTCGAIFATAKHEDNPEQDLLALDVLTLLPGWTLLTISSGLFMLRAVDRLYQPVGYGAGGDRYANPYWRDGLVYDFEASQGQSPLADATRFGPGPLFYLYLSDPHWGCKDFKVRFDQGGRLLADPTSTLALSSADPRRLSLVCRPDFAHLVHPDRRPLGLVCPEALRRGYTAALDGTQIWLRGAMNGAGLTHPLFAPEFSSGGPSNYYRIGLSASRRDWPDGSTDRYLLREERI